MKAALYGVLVLVLAPLEATMTHYLEIAGIRPDFSLIAACLIGFRSGPLEGMGMGIALGLGQDILSAGGWGMNLATKGLAGLLAGLAGRQITGVTPATTLSAAAGLVFLWTMAPELDWTQRLGALPRILLPETAINTVLGGALFWLLEMRRPGDARLSRGLVGFLR
jgi:rod shape-determining protein MreD